MSTTYSTKTETFDFIVRLTSAIGGTGDDEMARFWADARRTFGIVAATTSGLGVHALTRPGGDGAIEH